MTHQELPSYDQAPAGAIRFNTDSRKLEVYTGGPVGYGTLPNGQWMQVDSFTPDIAIGGTRGIVMGGYVAPVSINTIEYITIDTTGNAIDFGDTTTVKRSAGALASSTRGVFAGGSPGQNVIDYITISITGNAIDFGDLHTTYSSTAGSATETRGLTNGGYASGNINVINYITIASTGDSNDFGDLTEAKDIPFAFTSSTRGIIGGGTQDPPFLNGIDFVTVSTLGNAASFGDLSAAKGIGGGCSNSTRGLFGGGTTNPGTAGDRSNTIEYITIATLGNAIDFGDLTQARQNFGSGSSKTRGFWAGGLNGPSPADTNIIDYVQIPSLGNAIDFGDLTVTRRQTCATSNGHGGL
jgi:hypothetical protein